MSSHYFRTFFFIFSNKNNSKHHVTFEHNKTFEKTGHLTKAHMKVITRLYQVHGLYARYI